MHCCEGGSSVVSDLPASADVIGSKTAESGAGACCCDRRL